MNSLVLMCYLGLQLPRTCSEFIFVRFDRKYCNQYANLMFPSKLTWQDDTTGVRYIDKYGLNAPTGVLKI